MKLIVCLDDRMGMAFNRRRQSRDRVLLNDLCAHVGKEPIYLLPYSLPLFEDLPITCLPLSPALSEPKDDSFVFLETTDPSPLADRIDELILYRWNRHYPSDLTFSMDLKAFTLTHTEEFVGSSHEKITKEVWKR